MEELAKRSHALKSFCEMKNEKAVTDTRPRGARHHLASSVDTVELAQAKIILNEPID